MTTIENRPTIGLCMVVKDDADVLRACVDSCRPLISYWVICDAGSTDGTQELIRRELADIPGELHERSWVDFDHNWTEAMQYARGKADYLLLLDADCAIDAQPEQLTELTADSYLVRCDEVADHYRVTLVSGKLDWRFSGDVAGYVHSADDRVRRRLEGISIGSTSVGVVRKPRVEREIARLEAEYERNRSDARSAFWLGRNHAELSRLTGEEEQLRRAAGWYRVRADMDGWIEETYCAWLEFGRLSAELGDWPTAADAFTRGWQARPERLEAVHALTIGLRERRLNRSANRFASIASSMKPLPQPDDLLFVEPWIYRWGLLFEYSITAHWCDELDVALAANKRLLAIDGLPAGHRTQTTTNMRHTMQALVQRAAATAPPRRSVQTAGTPSRGLRTPDALMPAELRAPGLARRLAALSGMAVQEVDRRLLGLGPAVEVEINQLANWPLHVRPGTTDVATIDLVCNAGHHLPLHELGDPLLIVDLGAHIGLVSVDLARRYPTAHVVAVEMDRANLALCAQNLGPLGDRVTLVGAAIAATDGSVRYTTVGDPGHHQPSTSGEEETKAISLATLFENTASGKVVDYLKMSIEGSEEAILRGTDHWPRSVQSINVTRYASSGVDRILQDLRRAGFEELTESPDHTHVLGVRRDARAWRSGAMGRVTRRVQQK